jgi:hypothetical protein
MSAPPSSAASRPLDVPSAVQALLLSTKKLHEVLERWSTARASDGDVSDVYVQIGHDFNAVIAAFAHYSIDLTYVPPPFVFFFLFINTNHSDLHTIPTDLRVVLESCLSEDPSPQQVASCMPHLRKVLYKLLKGLQARQDPWRAALRQAQT